jgi:hypothetical protein
MAQVRTSSDTFEVTRPLGRVKPGGRLVINVTGTSQFVNFADDVSAVSILAVSAAVRFEFTHDGTDPVATANSNYLQAEVSRDFLVTKNTKMAAILAAGASATALEIIQME